MISGGLAPGALADIIIIDLSGRNTLRYGPVRDPVKSVVECGVGDDVDTVIVDGKSSWKAASFPASISSSCARRRKPRPSKSGKCRGLGPLGRTHERGVPLVVSRRRVARAAQTPAH